jgi:hypothetical protein
MKTTMLQREKHELCLYMMGYMLEQLQNYLMIQNRELHTIMQVETYERPKTLYHLNMQVFID